ncbi:MAG: hypothetical protein CL724_09575 [Chloroflexi bacterium]|nr:hypothetical protein [Chloroflexota bacterium]
MRPGVHIISGPATDLCHSLAYSGGNGHDGRATDTCRADRHERSRCSDSHPKGRPSHPRCGFDRRPISAPQPPPSSPSSVEITCIFFDSVIPTSESDEFVEIQNTAGTARGLVGWALTDIADGTPTFRFPAVTLGAGQPIYVYTNEFHLESGGFTFGRGASIWNNGDPDDARLFDNSGTLASCKSLSARLPDPVLSGDTAALTRGLGIARFQNISAECTGQTSRDATSPPDRTDGNVDARTLRQTAADVRLHRGIHGR